MPRIGNAVWPHSTRENPPRKDASAKRGKSIGQLIGESLEFYGIKTSEEARQLVQRVRESGRLDETQTQTLANEQAQAAHRP